MSLFSPRHDPVSMPVGLSASRRRFLSAMAMGGLYSVVPGALAEQLVRTPRQGAGPFYPDQLPLDTDNDLVLINEGITPAVGEITWLGGRILDARGEAVKGATVEIWQVDGRGVYLHQRSANRGRRDANFQGYGRFLTGRKGEYLFRTIKPVSYPGRTPHIHFAVQVPGMERRFTTQCYVQGEAGNERDGLLRRIEDPARRAAVVVGFDPIEESTHGELRARFDIVLGWTPEA